MWPRSFSMAVTPAKRALARGDDPEVVIQRIAYYRAEDKDNPNYYARLTVSKAQSHLKATRTSPRPDLQGKSAPLDTSQREI
jgi:hypothetical protein